MNFFVLSDSLFPITSHCISGTGTAHSDKHLRHSVCSTEH